VYLMTGSRSGEYISRVEGW